MTQQAMPLEKAAARATGSPPSARRGRLAHAVGRAVVACLLNGLTAMTLSAAFPGANGEIAFNRAFPAQGAAPPVGNPVPQ